MLVSDAQIGTWVASAWLPFVRISGAVMAAPLFGSSTAPVRIRLLLALMVAVLLIPVLPEAPAIEPVSLQALILSINELLLGLCMGFLVQLVFEAVIYGGQVMAMGMGLGFAMLADPLRGVSVPVLSQYLLLITMLLFMAMGGHLEFLRFVAGSFQVWPVGGASLSGDTISVVLDWSGEIFRGALQIALPAVVALLLVQVSVGVISRAAPTLNLFAVGFPIAMLLGFLTLEHLVPALPPVLSGLFVSVFEAMNALLESADG